MRGPGLRLPLEVRRTWLCPQCGKERKVPGDQAQVRCGCTADGVLMKLVQEPVSVVLRSLDPRPIPAPSPKRSTDLPRRDPEEAVVAEPVVPTPVVAETIVEAVVVSEESPNMPEVGTAHPTKDTEDEWPQG